MNNNFSVSSTPHRVQTDTHSLFPAVVREHRFGNLPINILLKDRVKAFQDNHSIKNATRHGNVATVNGYQPDITLHQHWEKDTQWQQFLTTYIHPSIQAYLAEHGRLAGWPTPKFGYTFAASWAVLYPAGAYQIPHIHRNIFCVLAYYVNVPVRPKPEGAISFINPHLESTFSHDSAWEYHQNFYPKSGTAIVFPGWLQHYSHPHHGNEERLLLTFDVQLLPPD